ncbi:general substrate transporter [Vararia minispora EC-137]|uniref:General substrate transporter n=1 Tax=Vararia minispora EC-137 TaxID=1314806 RepID=A0ACB8QRM6_9AGAM|nr:general substrate transporter [Vararia minispora EC-137]
MGLAFNIFATAFCSIGSYDSGVISSVLTMKSFGRHFHQPNDNIVGAVVSTFNGGCFFGAAAGGWLNDRLGRRLSIQACNYNLVGVALQTAAPNMACMLVGRIIGGLAIGLLSMTVPLYNASTEIAPPKIRGFIVGLSQQMLGIGFIVANWVGFGTQFMATDAAWQIPISLQMVPAFLLLVGIQFLPQSPRWLIEIGRDEEAHKVIRRLHGAKADVQAHQADEEFQEMAAIIKAEVAVRSRNVMDLFRTRAMAHRTLVAVGVQVFGQFTGINVINYYGPRIYSSLGFSSGSVVLIQGLFSAAGPITNFFFITLVIDRVGRRKPLIFGCIALVALFSILAAIIASFPPDAAAGINHAGQRAGIAMIFLMTIVFSLSFGPVSWVLAAEVFPTATRSIGTSVATCSNWAFNVMLSQVSPIAMANIGWKFYILFIVLNTVDGGIVYAFFPETKGLALEQMAEVFGDAVDVKAAPTTGVARRISADNPSLEKA